MKTRQAAFSLVEVMIVIVILVDLALIALPAFERARKQAQNSRLSSDLRVATSAFEMYATENTSYPPEAARAVLPNGMGQYLRGVRWTTRNSIGAYWDWDYNQSYAKAAVCVDSDVNIDSVQMTNVDTQVDNGVLATGSFRERTPNRRWALIIE
jgi:prepilin-type N-terminal cleavage/methylation domain-containing protein